MSKNKDTQQPDAKQPDFMEELLKNGNVTLKAKTRENLAEMVNDIPSDVKYCAGAVGQNFDEGCFTLRVDINSK